MQGQVLFFAYYIHCGVDDSVRSCAVYEKKTKLNLSIIIINVII